MTIKELLESEGAIGKENAMTSKSVIDAIHISKRALVDRVANERKGGALICSTPKGQGGYYLPANGEEILEQKVRLEIGIAKRANVLKPFREWAKTHKGEP